MGEKCECKGMTPNKVHTKIKLACEASKKNLTERVGGNEMSNCLQLNPINM